MNKISPSFIVAIVLLGMVACTSDAQKYVKEELSRSNNALNALREQCSALRFDNSSEAVAKLESIAASPNLDVSEGLYELDTKQKIALAQQRHLVDSMRLLVDDICKDYVRNNFKTLVKEEPLVEGVKTYPFYLQKGARVIVNYSGAATAKWYNADSRKLLKTWLKGACSDTLNVENSAIYLFEVISSVPEYCSVELLQKVLSVRDFGNAPTVSVEQVEARAGEFRVKKVPGINMKTIFEEPHKMTVRSKLKNFMDTSSPYRTVAAVKIPAGSTDLLYHLRISTDDSDNTRDGQFCEDVVRKYKEVKFLGLPLYETTKTNNSIFKEIFSGLYVQREEKAYCNLYVFTNAAQAKRFQESADIKTLSYNMDYSIMGTQSINERIPVKGYQTIYLGIENTRQRYDLYLWLEALAAVPHDVYYSERYSVQ